MLDIIQKLNIVFLIAAGIFCMSFLIQFFYYLFYSRILFYKKKIIAENYEPVSVVICARNEHENLVKYLPMILAQDYPDFEVVVVNDCSEDETEDYLKIMVPQHPRLRTTFIKKDEKFVHGKKLALVVGIKAAKNELLLLTDADCYPESKDWIKSMVSNFHGNTSIVLGYGGYIKAKTFLNRLIRFDTVFIALQYLSFARNGIPYMGVGRNLAYRRSLFFKLKGFASHSHIRSGDDDLFVNEAARSRNTKVEISQESITRSQPETSFYNWYLQKRRHITTSVYYRPLHKFMLAFEPASRLMFYFSFAACLFSEALQIYAIGVFGARLLIQYMVFIFFTNRLKEKDLLLFLPLFDLTMPFINISLAISNYFNKRAKYQWQWTK